MVHFHHVADGVPAVVAGRNDHLGTGFADLLQLHVQALVTLRAELADAVEAAAATATEVVFAVALHFAEVFRDLAHDVAGVLGEAVVTDVVTRVLQGHGHLEALGGIDLDLALAQRIGQPFHIVQERDRRLAVFASGPIGAFHDRGAVRVPAFRAYDHLGAQTINRAVDTLHVVGARFPVTGKQGQGRVFPTHGRNGPLFPGHMEEDGGLRHVFRIVLGFAGVQDVHDIAVFLVDRDLEARPLFRVFLGHPFAGVHPVFGGHVHLGAVYAVHTRTDLEFPRHEALRIQHAAQIAEHDAHVDAVRAVRAATVAAGTFRPCHFHRIDHELRVDLPLAAKHFAERGLDLVGRNLLGIAVVRRIQEAAVRAQAAVGANLEPRAGAGLAGLLQGFPQSDRVHFQHFHFFIILLPTLVAEERFQIFLGVDGPSVAKLAFRHVVLQYADNPGGLPGESGAARRAATLDGVVHAKLTARHEVQHDVGKLGERRQNEHQLGREDMPQEPAFITGGLHTGEESGDEHEQHQQQDTPVAQRRQEADFRQRDAAQDHHKRTDDGEHRKGVGEPHGQRRQAEAEAFLHDDHVTGKEQRHNHHADMEQEEGDGDGRNRALHTDFTAGAVGDTFKPPIQPPDIQDHTAGKANHEDEKGSPQHGTSEEFVHTTAPCGLLGSAGSLVATKKEAPVSEEPHERDAHEDIRPALGENHKRVERGEIFHVSLPAP